MFNFHGRVGTGLEGETFVNSKFRCSKEQSEPQPTVVQNTSFHTSPGKQSGSFGTAH